MTPLSTNGLSVPGFPQSPYEAVHGKIASKFGAHSEYDHYAGAWNAVAYRYKAAMDHGDRFVKLFSEHGASPLAEQRYLQEAALYDFYSAGFSVFESYFYGMYSIGLFLKPSGFPLSNPRDQQKVTPSSTRDRFATEFPGDVLIASVDTIFADAEYQKMREVRNILTHRAAPGRRFYISIGAENSPPTEWKLDGTVFNDALATGGKAALERLSTSLLTAASDFVLMKV